MEFFGVLASHKADVESKINDLSSKCDYLAREKNLCVMNWHQYREAYENQHESKTYSGNKLSLEGLTLGSLAGIAIGLSGGFAAVHILGVDPVSKVKDIGAIGGGLVGAVVGGKLFHSNTDRREMIADAYSKYLDNTESEFSRGLSLPSEPAIAVQTTPYHAQVKCRHRS